MFRFDRVEHKVSARSTDQRRTDVAAACSRGLAGSVGSGQHGGRGNQSVQQRLGEG
jgi:hypothetical protein